MNVGFVGVGKLGKDAAEVMARHYDVTGYDIEGVYTTIDYGQHFRRCLYQ